MDRHFTVAVFVIADGKVVLHWHRKAAKWLPPGGHVEANELPDEAAIREVKEESGIDCLLVGERALDINNPRQLVIPLGIQLEIIAPGHQHIDLVYLATTTSGTTEPLLSGEDIEMGWYTKEEALDLPLDEEMRMWICNIL